MTTDTQEASAAQGEPIELYRFAYGPGAGTVLAYTDAGFAITHDGVIYQPVDGLDRNPINASNSLDESQLEVEIDEACEISRLFRDYPPSDVVGLTILRGHWDGSALTIPTAIWVGRVLSGARSGYLTTLKCEPAVTSLRRVGLRRHWQYMCPHVLYGTACGVNRVVHSVATSVSAFDARTVTVPGLIADQYRGGMFSWSPVGQPVERRTILRIDQDTQFGTTTLTLAGGIRRLEAGMAAELAKGCRHTLTDCDGVFGNAPNFGGMPYIPTESPHGTTAIYN
ncbi:MULTISPECIES: phage BR0599 family protein [Halomonas]|uniref:Bacteriophage phiJL001 Gp84 C-terminal domain-containing protein n=1 Tax=Halomonas halophila TaxID=29573 RepID=A0ABQ0TZC6_9GAMM|nr:MULTISPECIES: phage BR0599 family protein [Halomonas]MDR5889627.1 phage BR0599 family protein [Halomonas salina]WJY06309.1 phage BR0599 family protein [Halomonas halophila]GEK71604.1 hypothetical protein HHA04nite_01480 [Halomonas halophila]